MFQYGNMKLEFVIEKFQAFRDTNNTSASQLQFRMTNMGYAWITTWPCDTKTYRVWFKGHCSPCLPSLPVTMATGDRTRATFACHMKSTNRDQQFTCLHVRQKGLQNTSLCDLYIQPNNLEPLHHVYDCLTFCCHFLSVSHL